MRYFRCLFRRAFDCLMTLILWGYFTIGYILLIAPFFLVHIFLNRGDCQATFQRFNHYFFKTLFSLTCFLIPGTTLVISEAVSAIDSSLLVCNHISYLDPLVIISVFPRHKTIVKHTFFKVPLFSWFIKQSGYISTTGGKVSAWRILDQLVKLKAYLKSSGNLFIFPEGTRSRSGLPGKLNRNVFELAVRCEARIQVLFIQNTNWLFRPGRFLLDTSINKPMTLHLLETIDPDYHHPDFSVDNLVDRIEAIYKKHALTGG